MDLVRDAEMLIQAYHLKIKPMVSMPDAVYRKEYPRMLKIIVHISFRNHINSQSILNKQMCI